MSCKKEHISPRRSKIKKASKASGQSGGGRSGGKSRARAKKDKSRETIYTPNNHAIHRILQIQYLTPRIDLYLFTQITQRDRLGDFCNRSDLENADDKVTSERTKADSLPEM